MDVSRELLLAELPLPISGDDPELAAIEIAIAVEESFGIRLSDGEMTAEHLGTASAVAAVVARHIGPD